ncbi:MAG: polyprenyl synthetase family protein [Bacteroidales bacterium]|nr:polyprenyl synthetase family protein [Bacteroidales bacterium]
MYSFQELQDIIEKKISSFDFNNEPKELYEPFIYTLSNGGKRIRPVLTLMACNLFNDKIDDAIYPAAGLEIFHNFTLLHDDIMDNSSLRRNKPTVHIKWNTNVAILSGDAMLIKAYEYISKCKPEIFKNVFKTFNKTALEVCEGQQFDMNFEQKETISINDYLKMIKLKTSVLLGACLKIGAIIGGASSQDTELLYNFGVNIGLAFQIKDDLLDVYGNSETFGKNIGGDIIANKKTYLLIKAFELAKHELLTNLKYQVNAKYFDTKEKISIIKDIYNKLGIKQITEDKINYYYKIALNKLEKLNISPDKKNELEIFAKRLIVRDK